MIKFGLVTAFTAALSAGGWLIALAQADLEGTAINTIIPATALTATTGALVWVVRQIISGTLVHRDPAKASEEMREALEASTKALEGAGRREDRMFNMLGGARPGS